MTENSLDQKLAQVLVEFAYTLGTDFSIQRILNHLVQRIVDILPVAGAGVMIADDRQELHFIAASNERVTRIESLQNELQEGPCLEAYRTGLAIEVSDLGHDRRFPRFGPRAVAEGLAAVFTFPMRLDEDRLGAVDLYRGVPGGLSATEMRAGQVLADVAAAYLFNAQARIDASATVARLNHRSLHDPLTGLPNRVLLEELLEQAVGRARRSHSQAALFFIDLDRFKAVNDRHGHQVGDELLAAVATRLTAALRPGDTLARLGGDEFVALCEDLAGATQAEAVAGRVADVLETPFLIAGRELFVSASVGIAFCGPGQDIPEELLRDADLAMYEAKRGGGARHAYIQPGARLAADRRQDLEDDLAHAQANAELAMVYQPIVELGSGRVVAAEALLRWNSPQRGEVLPESIVPSAERTGLILPLGDWILHRACRDQLSWAHQPGLQVAVNISAHQVMGPAFVRTIERVLGDTGIEPGLLCLEVTESVVLTESARALTVMRDVKKLGPRLSLDDFGTGYSSLSYLQRFPFDIVKVDRSFTARLLTDRVTRSIVRSMVDLGHVLGLTVTAEGVETSGELEAVRDLGADHGQGFYLGAPSSAEELGVTAGGRVLPAAAAQGPAS